MSKPFSDAVKGRAILARPSLRLLITSVALLVPALTATQAQAEQPEPVALLETDPLSSQAQPAASTEPFIKGRGDGAIAVVTPFGGGSRSPIAADVNPNNEVDIYANGTCAESPVANGTVEELEGEGIQAKVAPNSTTVFSAVQIDPTDPTHPSICSKPLTYWSGTPVNEPPEEEPPTTEPPVTKPPVVVVDERPAASPVAPVPPRLRTVPSGRANDNAPEVIGSAPGAASVKLFANSNCSGAPVAMVSPGQLTAGVEVRVPDNSTTDFAGVSVANGKQSVCSPPATYIEDSTPPRTRITMGPGAKTRHHKVVFRFADIGDDPAGASFLCKVDRHKWKLCHSPFKLKHLSYSRHTLRVRGTDPIGNAEAKPAKRSFKVVR